MEELILIDGERFKEKFPLRSLFYGEGLFETFRWKGTPPLFLDRHIERMKTGAEVLGIPFLGEDVIKERIEEGVLSSGIKDTYVKACLLSQGAATFYEHPLASSLLVMVREYHPPKEPVKLFVSSFKRNSASPILRLKSLNYIENIIARREARRYGFDEAIFMNEAGELTEGSATNIFWLKEGILFSPSVGCGLLPGVIRGVVTELAKDMGMRVLEGKYKLDSFASSDGGFITNSLIGAIAISQVNDLRLPSSEEFGKIRAALIRKLGWM